MFACESGTGVGTPVVPLVCITQAEPVARASCPPALQRLDDLAGVGEAPLRLAQVDRHGLDAREHARVQGDPKSSPGGSASATRGAVMRDAPPRVRPARRR